MTIPTTAIVPAGLHEISALFGACEVGVLELAPVNLLLEPGLAGPPITP
jgi:hypothetical protein